MVHSLILNASKSGAVIFGKSQDCGRVRKFIALKIGNSKIPLVNEAKNLGLILPTSFDSRTRCVTTLVMPTLV